ncbi:MAG: hypothetical protein VX112_06025 [Pseudomonadota bacterium]|nr:hypothetical protein [Pseudomonadota bacterium]
MPESNSAQNIGTSSLSPDQAFSSSSNTINAGQNLHTRLSSSPLNIDENNDTNDQNSSLQRKDIEQLLCHCEHFVDIYNPDDDVIRPSPLLNEASLNQCKEVVEYMLNQASFFRFFNTYLDSLPHLPQFICFIVKYTPEDSQKIFFARLKPDLYVSLLLQNAHNNEFYNSIKIVMDLYLSENSQQELHGDCTSLLTLIFEYVQDNPCESTIPILEYCYRFNHHSPTLSQLCALILLVKERNNKLIPSDLYEEYLNKIHVESESKALSQLLIYSLNPYYSFDEEKSRYFRHTNHSFETLLRYIEEKKKDSNMISDICAPASQYCIAQGHLRHIAYFNKKQLVSFSKQDLRRVFANNTDFIKLPVIEDLGLTSGDLAVYLFSSSSYKDDESNIFLFLEKLHEFVQKLPLESQIGFIKKTASKILELLQPTFAEYHRLDPCFKLSQPFLTIVDDLICRGADIKYLPDFYLDLPRKHLPQKTSDYSQPKFLSLLEEVKSSWLRLFSPTKYDRDFRNRLMQYLPQIQFASTALQKKHAFTIRFLICWRYLSFWRFIYSFISSKFANAEINRVLAEKYHLPEPTRQTILNRSNKENLTITKSNPPNISSSFLDMGSPKVKNDRLPSTSGKTHRQQYKL